MRDAVVTGASGFIGANLARRLINDGYRVHLFLRSNYQSWRLNDIKDRVTLHKVDFLNRKQLLTVLNRIKPAHIFNLAVYGAYSNQNQFEPMVQTNILGTFNLMETAWEVGFESFIQVGSSSEYGFKDHPAKESEIIDPNSFYAITKSTGTHLAQHLALSRRANFVVLRPYSIFGPYEEPTRFIPTLIVKGLKGKLPHLVNPKVARDYLFVDDFVQACVLAAKNASRRRGEIYNVGSGVQTTIKQAVDVARKAMSVKDKPDWGSMPNRRWDTNIWLSDSSKIRRELGWQPQFTFEQGFKKTVQWFQAHSKMMKFYQGRIK